MITNLINAVMQNIGERTTQTSGCILFGTVSGCIGLITQLPPDFYDFLRNLEERLAKTIKSVGKIEHSFWRSFHTDVKTEPCDNFLDGDLIEQLLDLDREKMREVVKDLQVRNIFLLIFSIVTLTIFRQIPVENGQKRDCTVEDVVKLVEDLTRIH